MVNDREGTLCRDFVFVQLCQLNSMNDCIYVFTRCLSHRVFVGIVLLCVTMSSRFSLFLMCVPAGDVAWRGLLPLVLQM